VIPALGRLRREAHEFQVRLGCIARLSQKRPTIKINKTAEIPRLSPMGKQEFRTFGPLDYTYTHTHTRVMYFL
jgi:hypothetical protein